jgi:membrane protein YdbS with pleckstrin-like domain
MNRNQIEKVLMKDEKVLYTYKPMFIKTVIITVICYLFTLLFVLLALLIPASAESMEINVTGGIVALAVIGITVFFGVVLLLLALAYRNKFYAVTNKRFIIQRGLLGIDFSSIPISGVQFISVNVSVLDKILGKGTGTPVTPGQGAKFNFLNIYDVYENYRIFKELSDKAQTEDK